MVMLIRLLVVAASLSAGSVALTLPAHNSTLFQRGFDGGFCGIDQLSVGMPVADEALIASSAQAVGDRQISVYWNVIHQDNTIQGGFLPSSQINDAISTLNEFYSSSGFSFVLPTNQIQYVNNPTWFDRADSTGFENGENSFAKEMKQKLHRGTAKNLNIYSIALSGSGLFGYATFPWWYTQYRDLDGVVFKWTTTPGGAEPGFGTGKILVHEVGHWLGLLHTFQGGCDEVAGDYIADTPAEASPARGCPSVRNTCPGPGNDPIHNHMDYTDDSCRTTFTPGQASRMHAAFEQFRANN
ncbi:unnamed protein product [Rhizoctonia solani]|uniref:Peptidase M43 pregnancy-associated plasma-A domain-containing protein n=1 Tax=Rhizoctonia solani TaxID=456999 RepID=A0A8H2W736_9AGAM|nr:unnamed protein product [Rhizoctonia solani]